ncbi:hypothetical protein UO65_4320 [Actinokineospora spheciospongiae]|uniref:Uncharacterized protein n=1 Tax=Actinokineospora spheciospongiae TaxID=909613 RepID=W7IHI7_9PSEU|nr:hypothetical protein UO65_4320 [Actinokineospora spheciospongiae]
MRVEPDLERLPVVRHRNPPRQPGGTTYAGDAPFPPGHPECARRPTGPVRDRPPQQPPPTPARPPATRNPPGAAADRPETGGPATATPGWVVLLGWGSDHVQACPGSGALLSPHSVTPGT